MIQVIIYRRKKKQKISLNNDLYGLKDCISKGETNNAEEYIKELLYNPYLDAEKMNYIEYCINELSKKGYEESKIKDLKNLLTDKKNYRKRRYYGPDGSQ